MTRENDQKLKELDAKFIEENLTPIIYYSKDQVSEYSIVDIISNLSAVVIIELTSNDFNVITKNHMLEVIHDKGRIEATLYSPPFSSLGFDIDIELLSPLKTKIVKGYLAGKIKRSNVMKNGELIY